DGQFSLHFCAAAALLTRGFRWEDYRLAGSTEVDVLCDRISIVTDAAAEHNYPERLSAMVEIRTTQGCFRTFVDTPTGEPEVFPAESTLLDKFLALASPVLGDLPARNLAARVLAIDDEPDFTAVMALTRSRHI